MPVIALAALVVVQDDALAGNHISEPVLEWMPGRRNGLSDTPNHHFNECVLSNHNPTPDQGSGLHVGDDTNTQACCLFLQHIPMVWLDGNYPSRHRTRAA